MKTITRATKVRRSGVMLLLFVRSYDDLRQELSKNTVPKDIPLGMSLGTVFLLIY